MTEQTYTYSHKDFDIDQAGNYTLLIKADADTFDYAVVRENELMSLGTNCPEEELNSAKLAASYKKTVVGIPAKAFTLVPTSLFDSSYVADMARLLDVKGDEQVLAQALDDDNYIIYKASELLINAYGSYGLKNAVFGSKGWLKAIEQSNPSNSSLYINTQNEQAEFAYFKDNKLRFYNQFEATSADELLYFILMVSNELALDQQQTTLLLSGNVNANDESYKKLSEYFAAIKLNDQQVLETPPDIPQHQLLSLLALNLCA